MALPTFPVLELLWKDPLYVEVPAQTTAALQCTTALLAIVNTLLGLGMTCVGSCDAVAFNLAGTNRWTSTAALVNSTSGNFSWFVLRNVDGLQIMLALNGSSPANITATMSVGAGYTGGALNAAPTATDQESLITTANTWGFGLTSAAAGSPLRLTVVQTVDGRNTYVFLMYRLNIMSLWLFGRATDPRENWLPLPLFGYIDGAGSLTSLTANGYVRMLTASRFAAHVAAGTMPLRSVLLGSSSATVGLSVSVGIGANRVLKSGKVNLYGMGLACVAGSNRIGVHGRVPDLLRAPAIVPSGAWFRNPNSGPPYFVNFGSLLVPFTTTAVVRVI